MRHLAAMVDRVLVATWRCKHCRAATSPGKLICDACEEHQLDELEGGEADDG